jgi:enediyne biosynthesis protein E4
MNLTLKKRIASIGTILLFALLTPGCGGPGSSSDQFQLLRKDATGLDFENLLKQSSEFNVFNFMYFYNGGGLAAGDFNNDGLVDLYFTSNMGPNKMFLNEGGMKFRDVTDEAGVAGRIGWSTGASVVDLNNDGLLDIYVGQMGDFKIFHDQNQLFICKGIKDGVPFYEDEAIPYGLDLVGFPTQALFFDYDLDGDLDMFQLNFSLHANGTFGQKKVFEDTQHPLSGDKLMRNDFIPPPGGTQGGFTEVTRDAGIKSTVIGYGLGVAAGDVNLDGWPDLYIGNDFHENDYLYINQKNGTFKEMLNEEMMHTSRFSMGVDIGDINNDGWPEIFSLDMLPEDPYILKTSLGEDDPGVFHFKLGYGYNYQYSRNTLQLNNRNGTFSEIGMFAGVHATDWSWAPLFMDFDDDGYKDLFISNGIPRRMNDIDYVDFRATSEIRFKGETDNLEEADLVAVERMPKVKLPNKFLRNSGNLRFEDLSQSVKSNELSFSNGAIYADLDNDGDLDVVVNNIEDEPFVYKNLSVENDGPGHNYLSLRLIGSPENINAIGAKVVVYKKDQKIVCENYPVRGYQSSSLTNLHIGVGDTTSVDSVLVIWPGQGYQHLTGFRYNQFTVVVWQPNLPVFNFSRLRQLPAMPFAFTDVTEAAGLNFRHVENPFVEFAREILIPNAVSADGPALAVGDVNGDGLDDVFFGGAKRKKSALYLQKPGGIFYENTPEIMLNDSLLEYVDAVLVDVENDGDLDLVIASGGNEFHGKHEALKQRAYLNDSKGNFELADIFKGVYLTAACVLAADINQDGLVDFFFGGRAVPWNYGVTPGSYLLLNKGNGQFEDVTDQYGNGLRKAGLVKSGTWADMDGDGDPDLVLALEWEPVTIFFNDGGTFKKQPINDMTGWWNFVLPHDFDGDGDMDLLAGNPGENTKFKPTAKEPVKLYINDFDENGQIEQILTYHLGGKEIPFANYKEITTALPELKKKYPLSKDFAAATLNELFGKEKLKEATVRQATDFKSMYFENTGGLSFKAHPLPDELQFSTLDAPWLYDLDGDGREEVLLGGNFYQSNIQMGRYDANYGNVLSISKDGKMDVHPLGDLQIKGQVRRIRPVTIAGHTCFILAKNDGVSQVIQPGSDVQKLTGN